MRYFLEIDAPQRVTQRFALPESVVQLGAGPASELRFEGLPSALLSIEARVDGAFVRLSAGHTQSLVTNGAVSHEALVAWGSDAFVDGLRLAFIAEAEPKRGTSPWLILALGAAVAWLGWQGADTKAEQRAETMESVVLKPAQATCPESSLHGARTAAQRAEQAALARQQRYSFDASEGIKAAGSFRLAEACFGGAGDAVAQARVAARREALERTLASDEVSLRLRLDLALDHERWQDARIVVSKLDELVAPLGATGYRAWLRSTLRWIDARSSGR
jgi:hypothetical protein